MYLRFLLEFRRKVLRELIELKEMVASLGRRIEPDDSSFHLETMDSIEQFEANEESLAEEKRFKLYVSSSPKSIRLQYNPVSNCNTIYCD